MATRRTAKPRLDRVPFIQDIIDRGAGDFVARHAQELYPSEHTRNDCVFPGYFWHISDEPSGDGRLSCVPSTGFLENAAALGDKNPLLLYARIEERLAGPVAMALAPVWEKKGLAEISPADISDLVGEGLDFNEAAKELYDNAGPVPGIGDVIFHVRPYGSRADELKTHLASSYSNGDSKFCIGECVGFVRAAAGVDGHGSTVLYLSAIQTEGYKKSVCGGQPEHALPAGLRKIYLDGGRGPDAWHTVMLDAIEGACSRSGVTLAIAAWVSVVERAYEPDKLRNSALARKLYTEIPEKMGYRPEHVQLTFPAYTRKARMAISETALVKRFAS